MARESHRPLRRLPSEPVDVNLREALEERYLAYALSTIMGRALPDARATEKAGASADSLRHAHPETRSGRGVQEMREDRRRRDGLVPSARRPGDLRGAGASRTGFRPRVTRSSKGQGNFGNIDGDNAAAYRYTEARLTDFARLLLEGIDEDSIDWRDNLFRRRQGAERAAGCDAEPARQRAPRESRSAWRPRSPRTTSPNCSTPRSI